MVRHQSLNIIRAGPDVMELSLLLHGGGKKPDIAAIIKQEIEHHFGLGSVAAKEIELATNKIWKW